MIAFADILDLQPGDGDSGDEADQGPRKTKTLKTMASVLRGRFGRNSRHRSTQALHAHTNYLRKSVKKLMTQAKEATGPDERERILKRARSITQGCDAMTAYHASRGGASIAFLEWIRAAKASWPWPGYGP